MSEMRETTSGSITVSPFHRVTPASLPAVPVPRRAAIATRVGTMADLPFLDDATHAWLREWAPVYEFYMWPVGYFRFLQPLLRSNPYLSAISVVELLDRRGLVDALERLLFDERERARSVDRQASYVEGVRGLPSVEELILAAA